MYTQNGKEDTILRQWAILKNIPSSPKRISTEALFRLLQEEGFTVTKRTVERNLRDLSLIFPLYVDERSRPYGWSWHPDAPAFAFPTMSPVQALTLSMARDHLANLLPANLLDTLEPYFRYAKNILSSGGSFRNVAEWQGKVAIVPANQPLISPQYSEAILETIHAALLSGKQLDIDYRSRNQDEAEKRIIHPLGLVQRGAVIYLVAKMNPGNTIRILALHRIQSAKMLEKTSRKPRDFHLDEFIAQGAFGFMSEGKIRLVARFTSDAGRHLRETPLSTDQKLTEKNNHIRVEATVWDTSQLRWWLMAFGSQVEVIRPASLRREFMQTAQATYALYHTQKAH